MKVSVRIAGRSIESSLGSIPDETYEFWSEREEDLPVALSDPESQDEIPESVRLGDISEYTDVMRVLGIDTTNEMEIEITNSETNAIIFKGGYMDLQSKGDEIDEDYLLSEMTDEYFFNELPEGKYLFKQSIGQHNLFFDTFETNEFAFNKFKVLTKEMEEGEIIYAISYDGNSYEISDIEGDVQDEFIRLVAA